MIFSTTIGPTTYHLSVYPYSPDYDFLKGHVYVELNSPSATAISCNGVSCSGLFSAANAGYPCLFSNSYDKCLASSTAIALFPDLPNTHPEFFL